jgi:hypothetical protein
MIRNIAVACLLACLCAWAAATLVRPPEVPFSKTMIDSGASETAAFADVNGDGRLDIVSGEYWYEAPRWTPHRFRDLPYLDGYIDNFSDLPIDVDGDGRPDIVSCSYFSHRLEWWRNPGNTAKNWQRFPIEERYSVEFAFLVDLDNDGKARELLPQFGDEKAPLTWYELKDGRWVPHVVSPHSYGHGIGAGDVNGDGRTDIIMPQGWFEAPPDPRNGEWKWHGGLGQSMLGFIHVLDLNGDGRNDLLTSLAHNYGIFWLEQRPDGTFAKHTIDESWSQAHSVVLTDLNGDGQKDILTGKRYMAHNGRDPGEREPLGVYWYEYRKDPAADGGLVWIRHVIDYSTRTGAGIEIGVADFNNDGAPDFAVAGKSGLFLFENLRNRR